MTPSIAYRLASPESWADVMTQGVFRGEADDHRDGFIHLSAADQVEGTLEKHYAGQDRLVLVAIDLDALGDTLKWEKSRGGALFPHVYGDIPASAVLSVRLLGRDEEGGWLIPEEALR